MNISTTCLFAGMLGLLPVTVTAQITPDGSTSTTVDTNGNVSTINAGEQAGSNLFHSFSNFSVPNGNEAYFNNSADIANIFSRVTGGNISSIDGLIRANNANLFLINPAGVIFGGGARLDIGGSFYGGTARGILFPDDVEFNANDSATPILTVNAPIGLNFRDNPEDVRVQSSNLTVSPGKNLSLLGGDINIDGGSLNALGGRVNLGAVSAAGTVTFDENLDLDFSNLSLADISLSNGATVNVNGTGGGAIAVNARNLTLSQASKFSAGINSAASTPETQAGNIAINVSETIALESGSLIRNNLGENSSGNAGNIEITAQNLSLADDSRISTIAQSNGDTGNIVLQVSEDITLDRTAQIKSQILPNAVGNGGDINVNTGSLTLSEGSSIFTNISGEGNAGNIDIEASDRIILASSNFQTSVTPEGVGNAGNINITTGSLLLRNATQGNRSQILANTRGRGNAGNITIQALTDISLEDSSFFLTSVAPVGEGNGGNIEITTTNLSLTGESQETRASLLADSRGIGDAGNIIINASGNISLNEYGLIVSQVSEGRGNAGAVTIDADGLFLNTGSYIISNTGDPIPPLLSNVGDAGNITINSRIISLDNFSEITSNSLSNATGQAGDISVDTDTLTIAGGSNINSLTENSSPGGEVEINAQNIELVTGGKIVTGTNSDGSAGNITLNVTDQITINGDNAPIPTEELRFREVTLQGLEPNTGLFANTTSVSSGDGGNIQIESPKNFFISNGGEVAVDSQGTGNGGNLAITANSLDLDNQSQLIAETEFGQAQQQPSNINLQIDDVLFLQGDSKISAQAFNNANGGNVNINAEFVIAFPAKADGNDIVANANEGSGGSINIKAQEIFGLEEREAEAENMTNDLDVSSKFGFDGNLSINTPDVSATKGVRDLPVNAIAPEESVQQACAATNLDGKSSLSLKGRGDLPIEPTAAMASDNILLSEQFSQANKLTPSVALSQNSYQELSTEPKQHPPIVTSQGSIYPARGLIVTEKGEIILTPFANKRTSESIAKISGCFADFVN